MHETPRAAYRDFAAYRGIAAYRDITPESHHHYVSSTVDTYLQKLPT